ncbi:MAG: hypothetical protein HQ500_08300 [Flavobacteriales bacterium]|nr:hypothetical protein [Flavobacteriales bacterium]
MKKVFLIIGISIFAANGFAQSLETQPQAEGQAEEEEVKCVKKGNVIFDLYYGPAGPGLAARLLAENENGQTSFLGPIGLRAQYMVTDAFGIGLDAHYATRGASWTSYDLITGEPYEATYDVVRIRAMARFSWEFLRTERFNMNWANSVGYKSVKRTFDDPFSTEESTNVIPVAFRTAVGFRFFVTDNIGLNADIGFFGGAFVHGGLSVKL